MPKKIDVKQKEAEERQTTYDKLSVQEKIALLEKKIIQEQGVCPECGYDDGLEYGDSDLDGESMGYSFTCPKCGCIGKEWYDVIYSETIVEGSGDDEGK